MIFQFTEHKLPRRRYVFRCLSDFSSSMWALHCLS